MKKYLSLMLVIVLCLSLVSCKAEIDNEDKATKDETIATPLFTDDNPSYVETNYISCLPASEGATSSTKICVAQVGNTVFGTDTKGMWKCVDNKEFEYISDKKIQSFVTNGESIIYNCYNKDIYDSEIRMMDCNGENDALIMEDSSLLEPLMKFGDKIYLYDDFNEYSTRAIFTYNFTDSAFDEIISDTQKYVVIDKTIYFTIENPENYDGQLKCYDPAFEQIKEYESDTSFYTYNLLSYNRGAIVTSSIYDEDTDESKTTVHHIDIHNQNKSAQLATISANFDTIVMCGDDIYLGSNYSEESKYILTTNDSKVTEFKDVNHLVNNVIKTESSLILEIDNETGCCFLYYDDEVSNFKTIKNFTPDKADAIYCCSEYLYYIKDGVVKKEKLKLNDKIPSSVLEKEPKKTRPESQETEYVYTKKECDTIFSGEFDLTGQHSIRRYKTKSRLPQLNIDSQDSKKINHEIMDIYGADFEKPDNLSYTKVDYVTYLNANVLSLVIGYPHSYRVYNIDVNTGKQLSNEELMQYTNISLSDAHSQVSTIIENLYDEIIGTSEYGKECKARCLEQENLDKTNFYIDGDKNIVACYQYEMLAGSGGIAYSIATLNGSFIY